MPPGFTADRNAILKVLVRLGKRQRSSSPSETALDLRDTLDSAAVPVGLVLDQRAVFDARLNSLFYHEIPPLMSMTLGNVFTRRDQLSL